MTRLRTAIVIACIAACGEPPPDPAAQAIPRTHAHNDYLHEHALFEALHHGFVDVEVDVFLVGDDLRVAHQPQRHWTIVPTLATGYLSPLNDLVERRGGSVYADATRLLLLVDLKTDAVPTYERLHEVLARYHASRPGLFTTYTKTPSGWDVAHGAVDVVVSGNRPRRYMADQLLRYAAHDGRLDDIGPDVEPSDTHELVPLVSDNWTTVFAGRTGWNGEGSAPPVVRERLATLAAEVHAEGKRLRLWNLPLDSPAVWSVLDEAGVDLISTDDLAGLAAHLRGTP
jgi:hypothetical protein